MKSAILVLISNPDPGEIPIIQKLVKDMKDTNILRDRPFVILDSDLSKLVTNKDQLINLARSLDIVERDANKKFT